MVRRTLRWLVSFVSDIGKRTWTVTWALIGLVLAGTGIFAWVRCVSTWRWKASRQWLRNWWLQVVQWVGDLNQMILSGDSVKLTKSINKYQEDHKHLDVGAIWELQLGLRQLSYRFGGIIQYLNEMMNGSRRRGWPLSKRECERELRYTTSRVVPDILPYGTIHTRRWIRASWERKFPIFHSTFLCISPNHTDSLHEAYVGVSLTFGFMQVCSRHLARLAATILPERPYHRMAAFQFDNQLPPGTNRYIVDHSR